MALTETEIQDVLAELAGIKAYTSPAQIRVKSRDYYWYSPILAAELDGKTADLVLAPANEEEVARIAALCARRKIPLTLRGGGTGNYGQCVPLRGGIVMEITALNRVLDISPGRVRVEAGCRIETLEQAVRDQGQALLMWPSTKKIATIGGFIAGGYSGIGSIRHGVLKDKGNVSRIRIMTVEEKPRTIVLKDADIQKVHHAFGTNGILLDLDLALAPKVEWRHVIVCFESYLACVGFGLAASRPDIDTFLLTSVERRFAPFYRPIAKYFSGDADALFAMVAPSALSSFQKLAAEHNGRIVLDMSEPEIEAARLMPAYECAYNHTTLQALKEDRGWTYLQMVYPVGRELALIEAQMARFGDEVLPHHEFAKQFGEYRTFALPLVRWTNKERIYEIIRSFEADGCMIFDPHVYTIEEGGMKEIDVKQIEFKRIADPQGLLNPGKTLGWPS